MTLVIRRWIKISTALAAIKLCIRKPYVCSLGPYRTLKKMQETRPANRWLTADGQAQCTNSDWCQCFCRPLVDTSAFVCLCHVVHWDVAAFDCSLVFSHVFQDITGRLPRARELRELFSPRGRPAGNFLCVQSTVTCSSRADIRDRLPPSITLTSWALFLVVL